MLNMLASIPPYARRVLLVGSDAVAQAASIDRRPDVSIEAVVDGVGDSVPAASFDCIVILDTPVTADSLGPLVRLLSPFGELLMPLPDEPSVQAMPALGLCFDSLGEGLVRGVRTSYDARHYARALRAEGRSDLAYLVLRQLVPAQIADPDTAAAVAAETQICLLDYDRHAPAAARLVHFHTAQTLFQQAVAKVPHYAVPYQCQAEFWRRIGDSDMACRLLRSIQAVAPTPAAENQLTAYAGRPAAPFPAPIPDPPLWEPSRTLRVLLITHPRPDYGLDVLYDGLRTVLGPDNVVEYPWKPCLHGQVSADLANYPCSFDYPGSPMPLDDLLAQLREGRFDLVLFGDTDRALGRDEARRLLDAAGDTAWAIVDQGDDPCDQRGAVLEHLGWEACPVYFKREMLACHDYGPCAYPLPFAYPDSRIPPEPGNERHRDLFWAGHREFGMRRLYLDRLEERLGYSLNRQYGQDEYAAALRDSRIGLSLFGLGFDTVRYWELPAHGCLLLAERPPIRIPHDFEDGISAVFFGGLLELEDRLAHLTSHPEEAQAIAFEGHILLKTHHTGSARARHLLARLFP